MYNITLEWEIYIYIYLYLNIFKINKYNLLLVVVVEIISTIITIERANLVEFAFSFVKRKYKINKYEFL